MFALGDGERLVAFLAEIAESRRRSVLEAFGELVSAPRTAHAEELQDVWRRLIATHEVDEANRRYREWCAEHPGPGGWTDLEAKLLYVVHIGLDRPSSVVWPWDHDTGEVAYGAAAGRSRSWRQRFVDRPDRGAGSRPWWVVHRMVRAGLVTAPDTDFWVVGALGDPEVALADPKWIEHDLWRIFTTEAAGRWLSAPRPSGSSVDSGEDWTGRLAALAAAGVVDRDRLIDEALAAQHRDFVPRATGWYRELYRGLSPAVTEERTRSAALLGLLDVEDSGAVQFALERLERLFDARCVSAERLIEGLSIAVSHPTTTRARSAVRLVVRAMRTDSDAGRAGVELLLQVLNDPRPALQKQVVTALKRFRGVLTAEDEDAVRALIPDVDPGLRGELQDLGGLQGAPAVTFTTAVPPVALPPSRPPDPLAPRLRDADALRPVGDVDDLFDRIDAALPNDDDVEEIELLLDALARLDDADAPAERVRRVISRSRSGWVTGGTSPSKALQIMVAVRFGRRRLAEPGPHHMTDVAFPRTVWPVEALMTRLREIVDGDRAPRGVFSTPTHRGGWIAPGTAVRRLAEAEHPPSPVDLAHMVLRLAPDDRQDAIGQALRLGTEAGDIVARALGLEAVSHRAGGPYQAAWAAANDALRPRTKPPVHEARTFAAERGGWGRWAHPSSLIASPSRLLEFPDVWWHYGAAPAGLERWLATLWPANREACYAVVARRLAAPRGDARFLDGILDHLVHPQEAVGPNATEAIARSLGADDVGLRALAVEVVIAALTDRRLDGATLGSGLAHLLTVDAHSREHALGDAGVRASVPSRWAETLAQVADAGPLGALEVQTTIEHAFAAAADDDVRRLSAMLELLRRLALDADAAITHPGARSWLEGRGDHPAAKALLAITGNGGPRIHAAVAELRQTA